MSNHLREEIARCRALPRAVHVLFVIRLVTAFGNFVFPFTTMYLRDRLGLAPDVVGLFVMANALAMMPGALLGGRLADTLGRRSVIAAAPLVAAGCLLACTLADRTMAVPWLLVGVAFLQGLMPPATNALVADLTTPQTRRTAFGYLYLGTNLGFAVGPLVAGFLFAHHARLIFLGNLGAALFTVVAARLLLPETRPAPSGPAEPSAGTARLLRRSPTLAAFLALQTLSGALFSLAGFLLTFQVNDAFGAERGPAVFGTLMTTNGLVVVLATTALAALTRRVPVLLNIAAAGLLFGVGMAAYSFSTTHLLFVACTIIWSAGEVLLVTNVNAHVADRAPEHLRGRLNALNGLFFGLGMAASPAVLGRLVEHRGLHSTWQVVLGAGLLLAAGMVALWRAERGRAAAPDGVPA